MREIRINTRHHNTVSINGESCSFYEAGLYDINGDDELSMSRIVEHLTEREGVDESSIIFEMDLVDCEGYSGMMDVTFENGCIFIWEDGVDVTDNYNIDGWTKKDGEYTIY